MFNADKLKDFFKYYDPLNPKHVNAVEELYKHIPIAQLSDDANWVQIYRAPLSPNVPIYNKTSVAAKEAIRPTSFDANNINWTNFNSRVSKYFTVGEVSRYDHRRIVTNSTHRQNVLSLAAELDKIREEWGTAIGVTSWYRPEPINSAVGGVSNSTHISGRGVDVYTTDGRDAAFEAFLDKHWGGAVGYGVRSRRGFTHLDTREGGWRRGPGNLRWNY